MQLRPYQQECVDILNNYEGKGVVALSTGLGKTAIATSIERKGRTLFLSHRDELVRQPERYYTDCSFGIEKAEEHSNGEDVVSASVQTLCKDNRLETFSPDTFHTIIVDEAHHAAAPTYKKILKYFSGAKRVIGLTATPKRGDGVMLSDVFDEIVFQRDLRWGIENNYLSHVRCKEIRADFTINNVKKTAGDFNQKDLERITKQKSVITAAAKGYVQFCHKEGRHTICYCVTVNVCETLKREILKYIPKEDKDTIQILTGTTDPLERQKILSDFSSGKIKCIINCMVLTEGVDLPITDAILNLRPTCNDTLFAQMVGRGTRLYEDKEYCLILDVVPEDKVGSHSLCLAPTLFGINPYFLNSEKREKLYQDRDLLEICDELSAQCNDILSRMGIIARDVNLFIEETENIIRDNKDDINKIAEKIAVKNTIEDDDPDFGDLYVEKQADEKKRYRIKLSYEDEVYISAPDLLDNVTIDFHVDRKRYIGTLKMSAAIDLVKMYCEAQPPQYFYCFSKKAMKDWEETKATDKQIWRVKKEYNGYRINGESVNSVNKLNASRLIDLKTKLNESKRYAETIKITKRTTSEVVEKRKNLFEEEEKKEAAAIELGKSQFKDFEDKVKTEYKRVMSVRKQTEANIAQGKLSVSLNRPCSYEGPASDAQMDFIESLLADCKRRNIIIPQNFLDQHEEFAMKEASFMISLLLRAKDYFSGKGQFEITEASLEECFEKVDEGEQKFTVNFIRTK